MQLLVNGEPMTLPEGSTLPVLIEQLHLVGKRVAVEINGGIVPRSAHAHTVLHERDHVEIVQAIGGG